MRIAIFTEAYLPRINGVVTHIKLLKEGLEELGHQVLIVTAGVGLTQEWGKPIQEIRAGDVVICPAKVKHWHGAAPGSAMTHISICEETEPCKVVEWLEPVTDSQYAGR